MGRMVLRCEGCKEEIDPEEQQLATHCPRCEKELTLRHVRDPMDTVRAQVTGLERLLKTPPS
jgi:Zn finger protein HypA/HybF involved in hydrogenase expression